MGWNPLGMGTVGGVKLVANPTVSATARFRGHKLPFKPWMKGRCYHTRVLKKWDKRYGFREEAQVLRMPDGTLVCHPSVYEEIRRKLGNG